jgi:hypothetical protein
MSTDGPVCVRSLLDASVHLPRRSSRWVAAFRDETGRQVWRTTGLREKGAALALAQEWEATAKRKREAHGALPGQPVVRVRPGSAERQLGLLTQREVAMILKISERSVREIERRAFDKLRRHPALRDFWREYQTGEVEESSLPATGPWVLSRDEIAAVNGLARTPEERVALRKVLALTQSTGPQRSSGWPD